MESPKIPGNVPLERKLSLIILALLGLVFTAAGFILISDDIVLIGLCIILGLDVKLIDQLIDDPGMKSHRRMIFPLALLIPLLMGYLAVIYDPVFGMVIGTAVGLLLAGKLDHPAFIAAAVGFVVAMIAFVILFNVDIATTSLYLIPMAAFGAYGDEFGHEKVASGGYPRIVFLFFEHRFLLKTVAAVSVIIGFADIIHLIGFLCWDVSYDVVAAFWDRGTNRENGKEKTSGLDDEREIRGDEEKEIEGNDEKEIRASEEQETDGSQMEDGSPGEKVK